VHWFDYEIGQRLAQDAPLSQQQHSIVENDPERWAEQYGWHTTTDSLGVARVAIGDAATVVARCETRYGTLELQRNTITPREGHRLLLAADAEVLVQVLDDRGAPAADVMITLAVYASNGDFEHMWNWAPIAATAAPDGIAHVRHLQTIASSRDAPADKQWRVRTVLPGFPGPGVSLSITEPPAEPIVLRLPPCGRVRARAEFAGQPMYGLKSAYLDDAQDQEREEQGFAIERLADADGWVRFPRVPLGRRYLAVTDSIGTLRANFAGPLTADQEVVVVLTPDRNDILLRGRIVDEERHPVAAQRFQVQARGSQFRSSSVFATDASGNFLVLLGPARGNNRVDQLGFVPLGRDGEQMQKRADAPPRELRIGVEDLGDLVLNGGALLAAGHFRSGGLPHQKRVSIWIERRDTTTGKSERWRRQQGVMYNQTEDRFEVRGGVPPDTYRLRFQAEGCLPIDPVPFTVGATDLLVDIGIGHALAASVLLPEHTPETDLTAVLVRSEPAGVVTTAHGSARREPVAHPWGRRRTLQPAVERAACRQLRARTAVVDARLTAAHRTGRAGAPTGGWRPAPRRRRSALARPRAAARTARRRRQAARERRWRRLPRGAESTVRMARLPHRRCVVQTAREARPDRVHRRCGRSSSHAGTRHGRLAASPARCLADHRAHDRRRAGIAREGAPVRLVRANREERARLAVPSGLGQPARPAAQPALRDGR
jgi:hypothetical protein